MRCPKCSFISFDLVDKCVKCGKDISAAAKALHGTTINIEPPVFLRFDEAEAESFAVEQEDLESAEQESEEAFDLGGEEDELLDFSAAEEADHEAEDVELDFSVDAADSETATGPEESGIDISDLAPEEETADVKEVAEEAATEEFAFMAEEEMAEGETAVGHLEDLQVEGIDLESSSPPAEKGKSVSSVRTGTALDDFEIDLGDLISKKK